MFQPEDDSYTILTLTKFRLHSAGEVLGCFGISRFVKHVKRKFWKSKGTA